MKNTRTPSQRIGKQSGITLVELLVAMTIGIFLMGAVGIIYISTATSSRGSSLESQMNEDASLALEILQQQIRLAGFSSIANDGSRNFLGVGVRGCDGGFELAGSSDNNGTTGFISLACADDADEPDAIAIRYEATLLNSQSVLDGATNRPDNCSHDAIVPWDASAEGGTASITLADNRYYIADDGGVPTLYCKGRDGKTDPDADGNPDDGFSAAAALIPNIEDLQIEYAITNTPVASQVLPHQVTAYVTASETNAGVQILGGTLSNWSRVAAVQICLLARTASRVSKGDNSSNDVGRYVDCGGTVQTNNDGFLRRAYRTTIQLRNARPGLPSPYAASANPWAYLNEESE